jgi:arsenite methyltransferase
MKCCNAYESESMQEIMGQTLRPGGFSLTEKAVSFCKFSPEQAILDLGCGMGATVGYLHERHNIKAVGLDPSEKLLAVAREKYGFAEFVKGTGDNLPFKNDSFAGVFAECTLSLMDDLEATLKEVYRVLKKDGWFVINDVYARNPEFINELDRFSFNSCMRGLHDINALKEKLGKQGFETVLFEDCSHLLKELLVKIVFTYGSMGEFWNITAENCTDGCKFEEKLRLCKPGYFVLFVRKGEASHE